MKNIILLSSILLSACSTVTPTPATTTETKPPETATPEQATPVTSVAAVSDGLSDLSALTFSCPQAALNAAAREAAKVPSEGHYQFMYFNIIKDSTYSFYEVDFKSNAQGESDLKYCVSVYCQQGQEPKPEVSIIKPVKAGEKLSNTCGAEERHSEGLTPKPNHHAKKRKHH